LGRVLDWPVAKTVVFHFWKSLLDKTGSHR